MATLCASPLKGDKLNYKISYENDTAYTTSLLTRLSPEAWNKLYAYEPIASDTRSFGACDSLQMMPWGSVVKATSFCYNGLVSFEVCKR